jgi:primosomal protein N''
MDILVEAKKEYIGQLCAVMCPPMIEVFAEMYEEASSMSKGRKVLIMYQKLLKEVPNWSNAMSKKHTDNIASRCAWFNDLLAAVFVACTKILSSVRLNADNKKIALKLPSNEVFIQTCYNNVAKDLYKDPYIFHEEQSEHIRDEQLKARFCKCIEATVKELIPVQQILQTYMTQTDRNIDIGGEAMETDTEDPDVYDEEFAEPEPEPEAEALEPEASPELEPEASPELEPEASPEVDPVPPMSSLANEFKTIKNVQAPPGEAPEEDDDVLFGDASEERTKKLGYN